MVVFCTVTINYYSVRLIHVHFRFVEFRLKAKHIDKYIHYDCEMGKVKVLS